MNTYSDPEVRWTAIAGVLGAATLVVAAVGLPAGLMQLVAVQKDIGRLTGAAKLEVALQERIRLGQALTPEPTKGAGGRLLSELLDGLRLSEWATATASFIAESTIETEKTFFLDAGKGSAPNEELNAKLRWLRDDLIPKVRAGYWS